MTTPTVTRTAATLKGGDLIVLPFRIPPCGGRAAVASGTTCEVFDTWPASGGRTQLRVIDPATGEVRSCQVLDERIFTAA